MKWIWLAYLSAAGLCFAQSEQVELTERMEEILQENLGTILRDDGNHREGVAPGMGGISDSERTEMVAAYLFKATGNPPFSHDFVVPLLNIYPDSIQDDSKLRQMLESEQDARNFHILRVNLAGHFSVRHGSTFIPEMAHMLLRDDAVGEGRGEYQSPLFQDVSRGTYIDIVAYLRKHGAAFEPPPEDLPHEQRKLVLARWLKENWPGCEHLALPGDALREARRPGTTATANNGKAATGTGAAASVGRAESEVAPKWPWGAAIAVLAGALVTLLRSRSASSRDRARDRPRPD